MRTIIRQTPRCRFIVMAAAIAVGAIQLMAQTPFNGVLLRSDLTPIKKARIYTTDERRYATTDKQGRFGLTDVADNDTLTIRLDKKRILRVAVDGRKSMKIIIEGERLAEASQDDELVNMGYGYVKRREYTGVSSGISGEKLRGTGQRSILRALDGLVPGLNVYQNNGELKVNIRGERSFNGPSTPLFIVDGVQVSTLDFVSVNEVEHVEILKDASQYGFQGANGAILVTTKSSASSAGK